MKACLLITDRFEATADLLVAELRRRSVRYLRWNLDAYPTGAELTYRLGDDRLEASISGDGRDLDLKDVASVWCRSLKPSGLDEGLSPEDRAFAELGARRALGALTTVMDATWINHPDRLVRANSKPAQLAVARQVGFAIPETIISNDPHAVRMFVESRKAPIVYKSLSQNLQVDIGTALFTGSVTEAELEHLDLIRHTPGIFQVRIEKAYEVRTTVVGDLVFSARIDSQAQADTELDWRHRPFDVDDRPVTLPDDVRSKIHAFMAAFGLVYGAFDFIVTPKGRYVFLEVNPAGQYMWVEAKTDLPITAALVDALAAPCSG